MTLRLSVLLVVASVISAADHGITIQATSPWSDPHGYTPVIITLSASRDVELEVQVLTVGPSAKATIRVPNGLQVRQTVLVPPANGEWFSFKSLDWSERSGARGSTSISSRSHSETRCVLIDPAQDLKLPELVKALGKVTSGGRSSRTDLIARLEPGDLPDRWQGYPDWLVLVLTPKGDAALDDAQRSAITTWVRTGGTLVVSTAELVNAWSARGITVAHDPLTGDTKVLGTAINHHDNHERWSPEAAPVPGTETVPVKTFVVLALAFAIVVGPLNLWWVRKRNARHLFLITTPVLSFLTCVVLIVASLLADGVSVKRSAVQVCYLDHRHQQLVRWTGCTYFAAFSRSSLTIESTTKVRVVDAESYDNRGYRGYYDSERGGLHLDWRQGQTLSGTVLPARLNRQLSYTETLPERRRLVVERSGAGFQVANGLGVAVIGFAWRDAQGRVWTSSGIANGESAALETSGDGHDIRLQLRDDAEPTDPTAEADPTLSVGLPLPTSIGNRIGREVGMAYDRLRQQPLTFTATLAAPLDPLIGPTSLDPESPTVIAFGHLPLGQGAEAAP